MYSEVSILILKTLVETSSVGLICVNEERVIVYANESAEKIFGYIRGELAGILVDELVPEPVRGQHLKHMAEYFQNPEPKIMGKGRKITGKKRSGHPVDVKITLEKPLAEDGKRYFTISIIKDEE